MTAGRIFLGETLGAFVLIVVGCGTGVSALLYGTSHGLAPIALAWGVAVALAVLASRRLSEAHLNPVITAAQVLLGRTRARHLAPYVGGQFLGTFLAAGALYALFGGAIAAFETAHGVARGGPASIVTASLFACFFPSPGSIGLDLTTGAALAIEAAGTFTLVGMALLLTDRASPARVSDAWAPVLIGAVVAVLIVVVAPLTQAGLNPARDFGPRLFLLMAGWGRAALASDGVGGLAVYGLAPLAGGLLAAQVYRAGLVLLRVG